jgi:hypothetical protein
MLNFLAQMTCYGGLFAQDNDRQGSKGGSITNLTIAGSIFILMSMYLTTYLVYVVASLIVGLGRNDSRREKYLQVEDQLWSPKRLSGEETFLAMLIRTYASTACNLPLLES